MPIIGHGDLASVLTDRSDRLYFAAGVSNSQEQRESEYRRELNLLLAQDKSQHIVYFGSLSVFYSDSRYAAHKREMEGLVRALFPHYAIVRLGNIDWGTNPHTIINFFRNQRQRKEELVIQDTFRYVVNREEFLYWVGMIPWWNVEMNVPGRRMSVAQIVEEYV